MTLSEAMIQYRAKNNLTQIELAKLLRMSPTTVCKLEKGGNARIITEAKVWEVIK